MATKFEPLLAAVFTSVTKRTLFSALGCLLLAGCVAQVPPVATPARLPAPAQTLAAAPTSAPEVSPTPTPDPATPAPAPPPPAAYTVTFAGLPAGSYPVHVHSICDGGQSFHIATVQSLQVDSGGYGSIQLASGYFGNSWCLIVYTNRSLTRVLSTRRI